MRLSRFIFRVVFGFAKRSSRRLLRSSKQAARPKESILSDLVKAKVLYVIDGDGAMVSVFGKKVEVRLAAIDCPEKGQEWGGQARDGLARLINGRFVYLEMYGCDVYSRRIATVYVMQNSELINVNEHMVMCGHAWVMRQYYRDLSKNRRRQLDLLERWARVKRVGLWRSANPMAPWIWKKQKSA